MPSPFPGMDPYLESWEWEAFHTWFIGDIGDFLSNLIAPKYVARPQQRVYVEHPSEEEPGAFVPDTTIWQSEPGDAISETDENRPSTVVAVEVQIPMPETRYESYLTIRVAETMEVVTVIELLSPSNKRPGNGWRAYLKKREEIVQSRTHLVELDLLRGGHRLPFAKPLPPGDYYAIVSRAGMRPTADAYAWTVRQSLPPIPIPLIDGDPDVELDLQTVFARRYDRAGYRRTLDYSAAPLPPFDADDSAWAAEILK